jgi:hypothetical protein
MASSVSDSHGSHKISTDPDQYMLANPVPFGILALEIFFGYGTLGSGFATGQK